MSGLQADELSSEFLKNFLPETIFLVDGEMTVPAPARQETIKPEQPTIVEPVAAAKPEAHIKDIPKLPEIPKEVTAPPKYKTIGENRKGVAVLVTMPDEAFMHLPQLGFLQKILTAIGLQPADVAYVNNLTGANAVFEDLQQTLQVNYIISFASRVESNLPHDKFTLYNPVMLGAVPIVFSHSLADLEHDQDKKKLLWGALQKTFL
ncbi:hypothetical protein JAO76_17605 [Pontibacter sp. BT310]|uniref:Uncharacterized protein n=1 Tax=Pontibacter populi TaxID=890055 RepID=A0ABS6XFX0_9BACT|nr:MULTISPECIES: hypothetical protein [Pontibacter]MBJ6120027.1 hypothetical protein [Pontibacter sp. BT310]MBR0572456.1 hypothetical protein [Microvirga sp. STS03]MBW3366880.1 hypothetical protein [Pontibacter populi]